MAIRWPAMLAPAAEAAYDEHHHDEVRRTLERDFFARLIPQLLRTSGGGAMLDLGCGNGLAASLAGERLEHYVGVDARPARVAGEHVLHDLREGLGPVGGRPFDLYLGTFGVASHVSPVELRRLVHDIARHARSGSIVALEALGLWSLEWPQLWDTSPGPARTLDYWLAGDAVPVHPWAPRELRRLLRSSGVESLFALDRSVQAAPKVGDRGYWPGLPRLRAALNDLLAEGCPRRRGAGDPVAELIAPLPPLPAGIPARLHHRIAERRRALVHVTHERGGALARSVSSLDPSAGGGFGHGLLVVGRVR